MKLITALLICISATASAQTTKISDNDLYTLGKVWGVMKYYHPAVSQGKLDWDSALLNTINSSAKINVNKTITDWLAAADRTPYEKIAVKPEKCDSITLRNWNAKWLTSNKSLNKANKQRLTELIDHPSNIGMYYTHPAEDNLRINTDNEKVYKILPLNIRLVELFRVWNAIEYFYPYKYLTDKNWDNVLKEYIPMFKNIRTDPDYRKAITLLAAELDDTHTELTTTYQYDIFGKLSSPFVFQIADNKVVITASKNEEKMKKAGIAAGDVISKINGETVTAIINRNSKFVPASNHAVAIRESYNYLFSGNDSSFIAEGIKENGTAFKTTVGRIPRTFKEEWDRNGIPDYHILYKGKPVEFLSWNAAESRLNPVFRLDDKVYIEFSSWQAKEIDSIMRAVKDAKGIVFDLRSYNNDGNLMKVFNHLFSKPEFFGIKAQPDFSQPGKFCFVDHIILEQFKYIGKNNPDPYKGQVIVLMNEHSVSAEEMWGMIFKKVPHVIFIGSQTASADGNKTSIKLTDGNELIFSGLGIYYPDGSETQRVGIKPDVIVKPTIESVRKREDLLLQKAFEIIDGK